MWFLNINSNLLNCKAANAKGRDFNDTWNRKMAIFDFKACAHVWGPIKRAVAHVENCYFTKILPGIESLQKNPNHTFKGLFDKSTEAQNGQNRKYVLVRYRCPKDIQIFICTDICMNFDVVRLVLCRESEIYPKNGFYGIKVIFPITLGTLEVFKASLRYTLALRNTSYLCIWRHIVM